MAIVTPAPIFQESEQKLQTHELNRQATGDDKIYVAVGKDVKEGKATLLWGLHNSGKTTICILHVHQPAQMIPFMGAKFQASKLKEEEVRAYRDMERQKMHKMLNEYLFICAQLGVRVEKLYIEMDSVEKGIVELVARHGIKRLIMGAAAEKQKHGQLATVKSKKAIFVILQAPISCHIWFVCKGCLIQTRPLNYAAEGLVGIDILALGCIYRHHKQEGTLDGAETRICEPPLADSITALSQVEHQRSRSFTEVQGDHLRLTNPVQKFIRRVRSHGRKVATVTSLDETRVLMPNHRLGAVECVNEGEKFLRGNPSQGFESRSSSSEEVVDSSECNSLVRDAGSENGSIFSLDQESEEDIQRSYPVNELEEEERTDCEMFKRLEQAMTKVKNSKREAREELILRQKAEKDAIEAIHKAKESENLYTNEVKQRKEMEALLVRDTSELNKIKIQRDEVMEELRSALGQKMALESQIADSDKMLRELEEKIVTAVELMVTFKSERDRLQVERDNAVKEAEQLRKRGEEEATSSQTQKFLSEFSFSEVDAATRNFDQSLIIGEGGYGIVYKGFLRNTDVAIKLLNSSSSQGRSEFLQEVNVLSRLRHPNLLTLIGACPEVWSLIYEYLPNGNLEERLACKDNTLALPWQTRIRIAVEVCSALIFLHSNKPHCIVHGDLKPANILLDANFISKLGDFGICHIITGDETLDNATTQCCRTDNPIGTLVYMDPEFLSTRELTAKSDIYSFGLVLLQLLTGRLALGIVKEVQHALDEGILTAVLDSSAGDWPFVQAKQLAHLALRCCEMNSKNRPDLIPEVWRVLEPMKAACRNSSSFNLGSEELCQTPSYFICPIFQDIMHDPRVAADGFTYEAEAIKGWLDSGHNTSPMTNLKLAHSDLIPNHSLRSAIEEWRSRH